MNRKTDLIIIGGGVLGTFHAYHAMQMGLSVRLIEKDNKPMGATVRNFGQVVPSGLDSKWQQYGLDSLRTYLSLQKELNLTLRQEGTVYIASNGEELALIEELHKINKENDYESLLLTKDECIEKFHGIKSSYCKGGLYFPEEVTIDSNQMIHRLQEYLVKKYQLIYNINTTVSNCETNSGSVVVSTTSGQQFYASKAIICNGSDFKILYPDVFFKSNIEVTKLQIMQTVKQKNYRLRGNVLTGLSIRRYESFSECPSYAKIKVNEDVNSLDKRWGIHIIFKQALDGTMYLGDSHMYADAKNCDDLGYEIEMPIDNYIIQEAKKIVNLPSWEIQNRWYGVYAQCKDKDIFDHSIDENIHIVTAIGGKGMTGSGGYAKEKIQQIFNLKK
ncbi:MAG: TIGR03364 family FAD-dependent oxidoreductase [Flavobacteriaceae bacterium]|nr:TIGR03364 family FAD-dependent oxidoreductase [Flavobacteriaceae bacterium]